MDDQLATAGGDAATAVGGSADRDDETTARARRAALAVDKLVAVHTPMLWQVARAAGLGQQDAEDVVQTVWVSLLSHLDTIRSPDALTGWLVTATRREAWPTSGMRLPMMRIRINSRAPQRRQSGRQRRRSLAMPI